MELEVIVLLDIGVSGHGEVLQGEVPLLVDVSVVVLRNFWSWDVVLGPFPLGAVLGAGHDRFVELLNGRATHGKALGLR